MLKSTLTFIIGLIILASCSTREEEAANQAGVFILAGAETQTPFLYTDRSGNVHFSWQQQSGDTTFLMYSRLQADRSWSAPDTISYGTDWFVNWADYPILTTAQGDLLLASHLKKSADATYAYDIALRQSPDGGKTWNPAFILNEDGTNTEHGFVSMVPSGRDTFISWLDGRNTAADSGAMTLRSALIDTQGQKKGEWELDNRVCDCCQTSMAMTENGPVVVYRDRSPNEFRDIAIVRFVDSRWTSPVLIHRDAWQVNGCPVNGPQVSAQGNVLAIAWFTASGDDPRVQVVFSTDGGQSFNPPVQLNEQPALGRVDIQLIGQDQAFVTWMEGSDILGAWIGSDGTVRERIRIASSSSSRSSGFPQTTRAGDSLLVAWTDADERRIKATYIPVKK